MLLNRRELNYTPIFVVGSTILQIFLLLMILSVSGRVGKISRAKIPTLVELNDGTSARVVPVEHYSRTPQVIKNFTGRIIVGLMNWNAVLPLENNSDRNKKPQLDRGIQAGEKKITSGSWSAGFALEEDFRQPFLKELAELTPQDVFNGKTQSALIVRYLGDPVQLSTGKWKVEVIANLVIFNDGDSVGKAIPFNKSIFVRAIDTPELPPSATEIQLATYRARRDGLEIFKIQDLDIGN